MATTDNAHAPSSDSPKSLVETAPQRGPESESEEPKSTETTATVKATIPKVGEAELDEDVSLTFPQKLMEILDKPEHHEIIGWLPHGKGFLIYNKQDFEKEILPKYFSKQSKYSSFTRKLNRWGFTRVSRGPESGAYFHQHFRKGGHRQVTQMTCNTKASAVVKSGMAPNMPSSVSGLYPNMSLKAAAAEQAAQQQRFAQLQQQHVFRQEMLRRGLMNSNHPQQGHPQQHPSNNPDLMFLQQQQQSMMGGRIDSGPCDGAPQQMMMRPGMSSQQQQQLQQQQLPLMGQMMNPGMNSSPLMQSQSSALAMTNPYLAFQQQQQHQQNQHPNGLQ